MSYPPQYQQPAAVPGNDRTTLFGWLGIVIGLCCCGILGIVFGILSINSAKRHNNSPTLGYIAIAVSVLNIVVGIILRLTDSLPGM